jgi:hypothetical protein
LSTGQTPDRKLETGESPPTYCYCGRSAYNYYYRGRSAYHYYYRIPRKTHLPLLLPYTAEDPPSTTTTIFVIKIVFTFRTESFRKYRFKN